MAVINCPVCLSKVEEGEKTCPRCGHLMIGETGENDRVRVYVSGRKWTFGNTLVVLLLSLLIVGLGVFLFLSGLKWPYEDAKRYYEEEKEAYEEQIAEYEDLTEQISGENSRLEEKIEELRTLLNSGEPPKDPRYSANAKEAIRIAEQALVTPPEIEASPVPVPARDSIFHARDIRETGKTIDQQRFSLYQKFADLQIPDYTQLNTTLDRTGSELRNSILEKKEADRLAAEEAARKAEEEAARQAAQAEEEAADDDLQTETTEYDLSDLEEID